MSEERDALGRPPPTPGFRYGIQRIGPMRECTSPPAREQIDEMVAILKVNGIPPGPTGTYAYEVDEG